MKPIKVIPILLGAMLLLGSCVKEERGEGRVVEGEETMLKLSLGASFQNETPTTRAALPESEEKKFKDIRVLVFKATGEVVTNSKTVYPTATDNPDLTIHTYSGNNRLIYIIANVADAVDKKLSVVQNLTQLNNIQTTAAEFGNGFTGKPLAMIGSKADVSIKPGSNTIATPIQMQFMVVKLSLTVIDNTPANQTVSILGWDIENAPENSFLILNGGSSTDTDANKDKEDDESAWLSTVEALMKFDKIDPTTKTAYLTQYVFENRRAGRVDKALPPFGNRYLGMSFTDTNDKGKAWFAPKRATCIVVHALHTTPTESKSVEARIYFGIDNHSDYNIKRGWNYHFTVTVNGLNDINIDTNIKPTNASFAVHSSAPLDKMDSHPDFRPVMISAENGEVTIEVLDEKGLTYDQPGFDATWVKVSPLNLMYHQVRQAAPNDAWQQAGVVGSFVRAKYIPHKSVRTALQAQGITGWNTVPTGKENDDVMTFGDATYRMCYKITTIPFVAGSVTSKTLCVYTDDYPVKEGTRRAQIKVSFKKNGIDVEEVKPIFTITQNGYLTIYDETNPDAGLAVLNEDGTPSGVKKKFGIEQFEEITMRMNPGIDASVQKTLTTQWGFDGTLLYDKADKNRNGYYLTANAVYTDVKRKANQPIDFGSYRDMYGNNITGGSGVIPNYGSGTHSGSPYYYPTATNTIYHPIYKSSAARYCHEKNRDINGDGFIDASETKWYLPSQQELQMVWISNSLSLNSNTCWSSTEDNSRYSWTVRFYDGTTNSNGTKTYGSYNNVRCVREL